MTRRFCQVIRIKPECVEEYKKLHASPPPAVSDTLRRANFTNYSISYSKRLSLLFGHFEYTGSDFEKDCQLFSSCEATLQWWKITDSLQESLIGGSTGSGGQLPWWEDLEEVFYLK